MTKFLGYKRKQFNGDVDGKHIESDKIILYLASDDDVDVIGLNTFNISFDTNEAGRFISMPYNKLNDYIGNEIELLYGNINGKAKLRKIILE